MADQEYEITIPAQVQWDLFANWDNSENTGTITEKYGVEVTESLSYTQFDKDFNESTRKQLSDKKANTEAGASYEGVDVKVSGSIELSSEATDVIQHTTEITYNKEYLKKTSYEREIVVGPNSKLAIYQQRFTAPGINVQGNALNTAPDPLTEPVEIVYTVRPIRFIKDINVVYGDHMADQPGARVLEINGESDDINHRYGGKYVWLVPVYTYNAAEAAVRFDLSIQEKAHSGWPDLAKGAGGSFRYLRAAADPGNPDKITKLILKRSGSEVKSFDAAYSGHTGDINRGRGLDYLYLLWATRAAY